MWARACLLIAVLSLAGCSSGDEDRPTRSAPSEPEPAGVAYAIDRATLRELEYDYGRIVTDGEEVVVSEWDQYTGTVLTMWLEEAKGIDLLDGPPDLLREGERISDAQEVELILLSDWHRRRYAKRLAKLNPTLRELEDFYVEFTEEESPDVGRGMLDWLRVFRESLARARGETVVAIPLDD